MLPGRFHCSRRALCLTLGAAILLIGALILSFRSCPWRLETYLCRTFSPHPPAELRCRLSITHTQNDVIVSITLFNHSGNRAVITEASLGTELWAQNHSLRITNSDTHAIAERTAPYFNRIPPACPPVRSIEPNESVTIDIALHDFYKLAPGHYTVSIDTMLYDHETETFIVIRDDTPIPFDY
jgi:hypothetical protein